MEAGRLRLHILASGSRGNASIVEGPDGLVLIDDGISRKCLRERSAELGVSCDDIACLVVTHEHSDHVKGLDVWCRHWKGRIVSAPGTARQRCLCERDVEEVRGGQSFEACGMRITAFSTSHDVADPLGLVFETATDRLAFVTDTGVFPEEALALVRGARVIALESNHDPAMLAQGEYPAFLKARVGGELGHLSNVQAAEVARRVVTGSTEALVAMHISQRNNLPSLAVRALAEAVGATAANTTFTRAVRAAERPGGTVLEVLAASQEVPMTVG